MDARSLFVYRIPAIREHWSRHWVTWDNFLDDGPAGASDPSSGCDGFVLSETVAAVMEAARAQAGWDGTLSEGPSLAVLPGPGHTTFCILWQQADRRTAFAAAFVELSWLSDYEALRLSGFTS